MGDWKARGGLCSGNDTHGGCALVLEGSTQGIGRGWDGCQAQQAKRGRSRAETRRRVPIIVTSADRDRLRPRTAWRAHTPLSHARGQRGCVGGQRARLGV